MTGPALSLDLSYNLIQAIRLAHALSEAGCQLHIAPADAKKFSHLAKIFGLTYSIGDRNVPVLREVSVDHMKPETRVGSIRRPLIFPNAVFDYCKSRWPRRRTVRASFPGLPTESRKKALNDWLRLSGLSLRVPEAPARATPDNFARRVSRKIGRKIGVADRHVVYAEGVKIVFSEEGRVFPRKAWNTDYYSWLLESEFVLCPLGDYGHEGVTWTYRFFESVLCGAIPLVETPCAAYEGFRFRFMHEPLSELEWSEEVAEYNFALAKERLTVPTPELRAEVARNLPASEPADVGTLSVANAVV